jgi:hypothetical protein
LKQGGDPKLLTWNFNLNIIQIFNVVQLLEENRIDQDLWSAQRLDNQAMPPTLNISTIWEKLFSHAILLHYYKFGALRAPLPSSCSGALRAPQWGPSGLRRPSGPPFLFKWTQWYDSIIVIIWQFFSEGISFWGAGGKTFDNSMIVIIFS